MSQIGSFTRSNDGTYTCTIKTLAIDELTPIEAISKLYELQQKAKSGV